MRDGQRRACGQQPVVDVVRADPRALHPGGAHQANEDAIARPSYFSVGTTMPRMMMFWQKTKTRNVGIAAMTSEAYTTAW